MLNFDNSLSSIANKILAASIYTFPENFDVSQVVYYTQDDVFERLNKNIDVEYINSILNGDLSVITTTENEINWLIGGKSAYNWYFDKLEEDKYYQENPDKLEEQVIGKKKWLSDLQKLLNQLIVMRTMGPLRPNFAKMTIDMRKNCQPSDNVSNMMQSCMQSIMTNPDSLDMISATFKNPENLQTMLAHGAPLFKAFTKPEIKIQDPEQLKKMKEEKQIEVQKYKEEIENSKNLTVEEKARLERKAMKKLEKQLKKNPSEAIESMMGTLSNLAMDPESMKQIQKHTSSLKTPDSDFAKNFPTQTLNDIPNLKDMLKMFNQKTTESKTSLEIEKVD